MEENNVQTTETTATEQEERKFTQAEMDKVINDRLARERENLPSEDDLKAFQDWKKNQQTEAERQQEILDRMASLEKENNRMKQEKSFLSAGYDAETAAKLAGHIVDGNTEEFVKVQTAWLSEQKKAIYAQTKEELLKATPTVNTGTEQVQTHPDIDLASSLAKSRADSMGNQQDILKNYM